MSRFVVGSGAVTIEVEDGLVDMLERLVREAAPRTVEALERELDRIVEEAKREWPVGRRRPTEKPRPHSKDMFQVVFKVDANLDVEATIYNRAGDEKGNDYAYKIRRKEDGLNVWNAFVVQKVKAAEQRLADILADELGRVLDGR